MYEVLLYRKSKLIEETINGVLFKLQVTGRPWSGEYFHNLLLDAYEPGIYTHEMEVIDDVSTWEIGDEFVIASTDFDFEQAERFFVEGINGNKISFSGEVKYPHYGEIYEGVDMRAEVGLLTRSVKIR